MGVGGYTSWYACILLTFVLVLVLMGLFKRVIVAQRSILASLMSKLDAQRSSSSECSLLIRFLKLDACCSLLMRLVKLNLEHRPPSRRIVSPRIPTHPARCFVSIPCISCHTISMSISIPCHTVPLCLFYVIGLRWLSIDAPARALEPLALAHAHDVLTLTDAHDALTHDDRIRHPTTSSHIVIPPPHVTIIITPPSPHIIIPPTSYHTTVLVSYHHHTDHLSHHHHPHIIIIPPHETKKEVFETRRMKTTRDARTRRRVKKCKRRLEAKQNKRRECNRR